jgi:hypothetical protein
MPTIGKAVNAGDRLGFALTVGSPLPSANALPYACLMQDNISSKIDHILIYALRRGHVSCSGNDGKSLRFTN